jgi:hypothetical protein
MLCFVEGEWPVLGGSFTIAGLDVLWPKKARKIITAPSALAMIDSACCTDISGPSSHPRRADLDADTSYADPHPDTNANPTRHYAAFGFACGG